MNILFDIGHPAHVHLFKNLIKFLNNKHNVTIVTRNKDVTNKLLDFYGFKYICLSKPGKNILGMLLELIIRDIRIFLLHRKKKFNIAIGTSVSIGHLSLFTRVKSYNFSEDDDNVIPLQAFLSYCFSTKIINPQCLRFKRWISKRVRYDSYHELAYLHPNNFKPQKNILKKYNLTENNYIILRLSSLTANHDINQKGLTKKLLNIIKKKLSNFTIISSIENCIQINFDPWDMPHILNYSKLLISDSQTMTAEAAVLGVPSLRFNSFVRKISYLEELEHRYGLTFGFQPGQEQLFLNKLDDLLSDKNLKKRFRSKLKKLFTEKIDFNKWMIDYFNKELKK